MPKTEYPGGPLVHECAKCADGFSMSVQASQTNYSEPRDNVGPWYSVEVGFPSHLDILLQPYAEDPSNPTDTVYGYVPSKIVQAVVDAHGGLVGGEIPKLIIEEEEY